MPALIRRFDEAASTGRTNVTNWGSGSPRREFLHVDDMASACLHLLENYDGPAHVNVGTGSDVTIRELAVLVAKAVGYEGDITWDTTKPDGTPQKLLDVSQLSETGWQASIGLNEGIRGTVAWYRNNANHIRS